MRNDIRVTTLREMIRLGHSMNWHCRQCAHSVAANLRSLAKYFDIDRDLHEDPLTPICVKCGSRSIDTTISGPSAANSNLERLVQHAPPAASRIRSA